MVGRISLPGWISIIARWKVLRRLRAFLLLLSVAALLPLAGGRPDFIRSTPTATRSAAAEIFDLFDDLTESFFDVVHASQDQFAEHILWLAEHVGATQASCGKGKIRIEAGGQNAGKATSHCFVVAEV
jgi:hypothetical protein